MVYLIQTTVGMLTTLRQADFVLGRQSYIVGFLAKRSRLMSKSLAMPTDRDDAKI